MQKNKFKISVLILFFLIIIFSNFSVVWAQEESVQNDSSIEQLLKIFKDTRSLEANFEQITYSSTLDSEDKASGKLYLQKPSKMRWEYQKPTRHIIIYDGKTLWMYLPDDKQVYRKEIKPNDTSALALTFLSEDLNLEEYFALNFNPSSKGDDLEFITLTPKKEIVGLKSLMLSIRPQDKQIVGSALVDTSGNVTNMTYFNQKLGEKFKDSLFQFQPPEGVEILSFKEK